MSATQNPMKRGLRATSRVRLRIETFEALMQRHNAATDVERARLCGMDRTNLRRIRLGQTPSLELAMHMASALGVAVEDLFDNIGVAS